MGAGAAVTIKAPDLPEASISSKYLIAGGFEPAAFGL